MVTNGPNESEAVDMGQEEEKKQDGNFFTDSIDELVDKPGGSRSKTHSEEHKTDSNHNQENIFEQHE